MCVGCVCAHFRVAMPLSCNYEILNLDGLGLTGCVSSTCIDAIFGVPHHHRRQADIPACSGLPPLTKKDTVQLHPHRDTEARQFMVIAGGTRATQMPLSICAHLHNFASNEVFILLRCGFYVPHYRRGA